VLQKPNPKTTQEWPEWVREYRDAISKDLNNKICENCGYIQAVIYAPAIGVSIGDKIRIGRDIFLCDECAKVISERLKKIESTIEDKYPDKRLYGKRFKICFGEPQPICFGERHPILSRVVFFYFILSGIFVFCFLYMTISNVVQ
jgi:hypothetical protein